MYILVYTGHIRVQPPRHVPALCRDMHRPFGNVSWSWSDSDISTPGGHVIQANISSAATLERRCTAQQVA